jgi:hypothetical protein
MMRLVNRVSKTLMTLNRSRMPKRRSERRTRRARRRARVIKLTTPWERRISRKTLKVSK